MRNMEQGDYSTKLVESPVGAGTLAILELQARGEFPTSSWDGRAATESVKKAAAYVSQITIEDLLLIIVQASAALDPYAGDDEAARSRFLRCSNERLYLAEALAERFANQLLGELSIQDQEFKVSLESDHGRLFQDYEAVYADGQFTWAGLRSRSHATAKVLESLESSSLDDFDTWLFLPAEHPRVFEVTDLESWVELVKAHSTSENPQGQSQPDWRRIAEKFDAVHLTWSGLLFAHHNTTGADNERVIPLRFWDSERTLWLNNTFVSARPIDCGSNPPSTEHIARQIANLNNS